MISAQSPKISKANSHPVSVPEASPVAEANYVSAEVAQQLTSSKPAERAAAVSDLPRFGGEDAFRHDQRGIRRSIS